MGVGEISVIALYKGWGGWIEAVSLFLGDTDELLRRILVGVFRIT